MVLTLREEESGAVGAAAVTEKGPAEAPVKIITKCLVAWGGRCLWLMENQQYKMTTVKLMGQEETVVTGKPRQDSKPQGLVENAHKFLRVLLGAWVASMEKTLPKDTESELTSCAMRCVALWLEPREIHHLGRWVYTVQKDART